MPVLHPWVYDPEVVEQFPVVAGEVVDYAVDEAPHIAASVAINLAARANPYVWVGTVIVHAGYYLLSKYLDSGSSSSSYQQNGGPGANRIRFINRISNYKVSRRSGSKPRRKCPPGFRWSARLQTCIFSSKKKGYSKVWDKV